jgi:hypothetical protein
MKPEPLPIEPPPEGLFRRMVQGWNRFWFRPADPLPLGFIRISCGLILLYIHLAYTFDLQEFFGKNAWIDLNLANVLRTQYPNPTPPTGWTIPDISDLHWPDDEAKCREYARQWDIKPEEVPDYIQTYRKVWEIDPRLVYAQGNPTWSIWYHVTDPDWMLAVHIGFLAAMVLFTIGFCSRIMAVICWLALLSYAQRSASSLFGMDAIMNVTLFYLMIGPSGAALSVDRLISRGWVTWRALRRQRPAPAPLWAEPLGAANLTLRLIQIHFCIIYFASGTSKLLGSAWWNGTALWGTLANYEFTPLRYTWYYDMLRFLCEHRWLWEVVCGSGVLYTLALEISFPFLVWLPRWRWLMIACAVLLHTVIAFAMGLKTFGLIMVTMLLAFIPPETYRRLLGLLAAGAPKFRLRLDTHSPRQARAAALVRAADAWEQVEVDESSAAPLQPAVADEAIQESPLPVRGDAPRTLQLETPDGKVLTGYALFERLVRSLRLLWPLALLTWIPGVASLGQKWYPPLDATTSPSLSPTHELPARKQKKMMAG